MPFVDLATNVFLGVIDGLVSEVEVETGICAVGVGVDGGARLDVLADVALQRVSSGICDHAGADVAAAFEDTRNDGLIYAARPLDLPDTFGLVHVPGLATDERFIDFSGPVELVETSGLHGEPDAMEHEPSRLLCDAKSARQFVRRDAVLGVGDEPDSREPLVQPERRILEDRADLDRRLLLARFALPETAGGEVREVGAFAMRTVPTVRPAKFGDEVGAHVDVIEVPDGFDESGREALALGHAGESTTLPRVSQVCRSPN